MDSSCCLDADMFLLDVHKRAFKSPWLLHDQQGAMRVQEAYFINKDKV
jgi:hypothetical protein